MFDNHIFIPETFVAVEENGKVSSYEMKTGLPYFRGIPLSMVNDIRVALNGREIPQEAIFFSCDSDEYFTLEEMKTVTTFKWEFDTYGTVRFVVPGGLEKGEHTVSLTVSIRTAYIAEPLIGSKERTVIVK